MPIHICIQVQLAPKFNCLLSLCMIAVCRKYVVLMYTLYLYTTHTSLFTFIVQHYKQKPGSSSSSTTSGSTSSSTSHHHPPHPPSSSSQSSSNQPDQSKPTVKHKPPHPAKDQGQSSSSQGRTHSSHAHAHAHSQLQPHGGKQPPSSSKGAPQQVHVPPGHKPHHSHNHPPHPHQSKSSTVMVGTSSSQSQHLPHGKLAVSASLLSTKPHHTHHTDGKHHVMPGMSAGASNKHPHLLQSGIHGAKSGSELSNALGGGSGHLPLHMKHQRPPQGGGMHGNPNSDPSKHRHHHKLHTRVSDPHLNHSYDQQKGIKRPHAEENPERKRLKLEPSLCLPLLPPLPPYSADPPPPPPPSSMSMSGTGMGVSTNATLPPLPLMGIEMPAVPPLPPPLPLSNPDESPPPPPPPPNH